MSSTIIELILKTIYSYFNLYFKLKLLILLLDQITKILFKIIE
jgi:hypothetical protein